MNIKKNVVYQPAYGVRGLGDLYLPDNLSERTPAALTIHGGGWSTMEKYQEIGKRGKRYSKTQNMAKPVITYKVVPASSWRKEPKARKGAVLYKFDDGATCKSGWHEMTGYPYQEYFEVFNE